MTGIVHAVSKIEDIVCESLTILEEAIDNMASASCDSEIDIQLLEDTIHRLKHNIDQIRRQL